MKSQTRKIVTDLILEPQVVTRGPLLNQNLDFYHSVCNHGEELEELAIRHYLSEHPDNPRPKIYIDGGHTICLYLNAERDCAYYNIQSAPG